MSTLSNAVMEDIKQYAIKRLQANYGFVGVAAAPTMAMLNSTDHEGNDIIIRLELKSAEAEAEAVPA